MRGCFRIFRFTVWPCTSALLKKQLAHLDPNNQSDPRIVILTPGPEHSLYFEHAYLAAYLGYPLVQGGDLIVRDGCVWLKSVGGLRQIDVLLNRLDDEFL
ncbi:circularly permuted type 2 ATP-grasp protein [uncultured Desulfuromusa sp.]|uniref:circularly permuted type 2 ATP-grasp protein n=1 Tax=uncultured Desulfuromusa sp. TaxID=219183 RepID=UPI002AA6D06C|nr:circularly permuted type 2 ATP-grasp protein [uncultured Desulfuromusa sp.]